MNQFLSRDWGAWIMMGLFGIFLMFLAFCEEEI
jgi:hypothetical protein